MHVHSSESLGFRGYGRDGVGQADRAEGAEGALKYLTPSAGMTWLGEFRHDEGSLYPNGINDFLLFVSARRLEKDTNKFIYINGRPGVIHSI